MVGPWRKWRPGKHALIHLVTNLPPPQLGVRDGFTSDTSEGLLVVRTPRASANFLSLGDFEGERTRAYELATKQLADAPLG